MSKSTVVGAWAAVLHLVLCVATVVIVANSNDPQAPLLWGFLAIIDFPVSLLYFVGGAQYTAVLAQIDAGSGLLAQLFYLPHLIHGLLGTLWWFWLVRFLHQRFRAAK